MVQSVRHPSISLAETACGDNALEKAIRSARSLRGLERLARSVRRRATALDEAGRLAIRVLHPQEGDPGDFAKLA